MINHYLTYGQSAGRGFAQEQVKTRRNPSACRGYGAVAEHLPSPASVATILRGEYWRTSCGFDLTTFEIMECGR